MNFVPTVAQRRKWHTLVRFTYKFSFHTPFPEVLFETNREAQKKRWTKKMHTPTPGNPSTEACSTQRTLSGSDAERQKKNTPSAIKHIITGFFPPTNECDRRRRRIRRLRDKSTEDECYIRRKLWDGRRFFFLLVLAYSWKRYAVRTVAWPPTPPPPLFPKTKRNDNEVFIKSYSIWFFRSTRAFVSAYQNGLYILFGFSFRIISRENNFQIQMFLFISVGIAYGFSSITKKSKKYSMHCSVVVVLLFSFLFCTVCGKPVKVRPAVAFV